MRRLIATLVAFTMVLAACGDDDSGATTTTSAATTTAATAGGFEAVAIAGFSFQPAELVVPVGTTVTWSNQDSAAHTVTSDDGSWDSGNLAGGSGEFSQTFDTPGTYTYHCDIHASMTGTIVVTG